MAAAGGAGAGVTAINGLASVFGGEDEIYLRINGNKVWPSGDEDGVDIESQQTKNVGVTTPLNNYVRIDLMEYDYGSDDDHMGYLIVPPTHQNGNFTYLISHEGEGSIYEYNLYISD